MIRAVLFDLDGTLLHVDTRAFIEAYIRLLAKWFASRVEPGRFVRQLTEATQVMIDNRDASRTNREVFAQAFYGPLGLTEASAADHLAEFYAREYPTLRALTRSDPTARRAVVAVLDRGLHAVLATNPIFPDTAIRQRMAWAGVADLPFVRVTHYENSHFCKPHIEYFLEVCTAIEQRPPECLMVGNDTNEDVVVRSVGMQSYLVTDHLINPRRQPLRADYVGSLEEAALFLEAADFAAPRRPH